MAWQGCSFCRGIGQGVFSPVWVLPISLGVLSYHVSSNLTAESNIEYAYAPSAESLSFGVVEIVIPYGEPFFLAASLALERAGAAAAYTTELNFKNANSSSNIFHIGR